MTNTAFIPVPIDVKPEATGYYGVLLKTDDGHTYFSQSGYIKESDTWTFEIAKSEREATHWLKPVSLSDMIGEAWDGGEYFGEEQVYFSKMETSRNPAPDWDDFKTKHNL